MMGLSHANTVSQERTVGAFSAVSVGGGFAMHVHRGAPQKVVLKADKELIEDIETRLDGNTLQIRLKGNHWHTGELEVDVTAPELVGIEGSGGTKVNGDGPKGKECKIEGSGGTEIDLKGLACETLKLDVSGGAEVKLAGAAKRLEMDASGGVDLETRSLQVAEAKLSASGGVSGALAVSELIDGDFSGGVTLKIKGHPRVKRMESSGGASTQFED